MGGTVVGMLCGPLTVGVLALKDVESCRVGVEVGLVAFGSEAHQLIGEDAFAEVVFGGNDEALVHAIAQLGEHVDVGLHLRGIALLVDAEATLARKAHGHGGEAVVVAGDAAGVGDEVGIGALQMGDRVLDGALNGVVAPHA